MKRILWDIKHFLWDMFAFVGLLIAVGAVGVMLSSFTVVVVWTVVLLSFILSYMGARTVLRIRRWRQAPASV